MNLHTPAPDPYSIPLWPGGAPGEENIQMPAESLELKGEYQVQILSNVSSPTLTIYPAEKPNGSAVLVCPGGGYNILAYSHEGMEVCAWLNSLGFSAGLLKYRVPRREGLEKHIAPLQDAQKAIGLMRQRAAEWNIDPARIGILGFSAGGHLSAMTLTSESARAGESDAPHPAVNLIPDFAILVYAAYLLNEKNPDLLSPEIKVTDKTPPTFLVAAHDDTQIVEGNARFYIEMLRKNRPCELHIFAKGTHGFGFKNTNEAIVQWPTLAEKWMQALGFLEHFK